MTRECQVRICERLGVRLSGPTRHWQTPEGPAIGKLVQAHSNYGALGVPAA